MKYKKYNETGIVWIGEIPYHWVLNKFGNFYKFGMGNTILKEDVTQNDKLIPVYSATENSDIFGYLKDPSLILKPGDIIIPARGNSIGSVYLLDKIATSTQTTIYGKNKKRGMDDKFAYYFMVGNRKYLFAYTQTAIPQITVDQVSSNTIVVPPSNEQNQIAKYLDEKTEKIDAIIEKKKMLLKKMKDYRQSLISEVVTKGLVPNAKMKDSGIEWIGMVPEDWEITKVIAEFDTTLGKMIETEKSSISKNKIKYIKAMNVQDGYINFDTETYMYASRNELDKLILKKGDLMICEGGDIGRSSFIEKEMTEEIIFQNSLHRVRSKNGNDTFYLSFLIMMLKNSGYLNVITNKATIAHFTKDKLDQLKIVLPNLQEQKKIVKKIKKEEKKIKKIMEDTQKQIKLLEQYKQSLISEVVNGGKKVPGV